MFRPSEDREKGAILYGLFGQAFLLTSVTVFLFSSAVGTTESIEGATAFGQGMRLQFAEGTKTAVADEVPLGCVGGDIRHIQPSNLGPIHPHYYIVQPSHRGETPRVGKIVERFPLNSVVSATGSTQSSTASGQGARVRLDDDTMMDVAIEVPSGYVYVGGRELGRIINDRASRKFGSRVVRGVEVLSSRGKLFFPRY